MKRWAGVMIFFGLCLPCLAMGESKARDRAGVSLNIWSAYYVGEIKVEDLDKYGGSNVVIGDKLDLDDEFGLDNPQTLPELAAWVRLGKRHRLIASWFQASYPGERRLDEDADIEGYTFSQDSKLETEFNFSRVKFLHQWNPVWNDRGRLGLAWGMEYYWWSVSFTGTEKNLGVEKEVSESLILPIPVLGIEGNVNLAYGLGLYASLSGAGIKLGDLEASYTDLDAGLYWNYKFIHAGLGYRTIDTRLKGDLDDDQKGDMTFSHNGLLLSVGALF